MNVNREAPKATVLHGVKAMLDYLDDVDPVGFTITANEEYEGIYQALWFMKDPTGQYACRYPEQHPTREAALAWSIRQADKELNRSGPAIRHEQYDTIARGYEK